ncbi:MAG: DinB family protein [Acidobacteriota bacterium]
MNAPKLQKVSEQVTPADSITESATKDELLTAIDGPVSELLLLMSSVDEGKVNTVPFAGSWTAAQLIRHVAKSIDAFATGIGSEAEPATRDPREKIVELRETFLDLSTTMTSPDFIVPEDGPYEKRHVIMELSRAFAKLKDNTSGADITELVNDLPVGPITKLEMLHFVLYHSQRHVHQMRKICGALIR